MRAVSSSERNTCRSKTGFMSTSLQGRLFELNDDSSRHERTWKVGIQIRVWYWIRFSEATKYDGAWLVPRRSATRFTVLTSFLSELGRILSNRKTNAATSINNKMENYFEGCFKLSTPRKQNRGSAQPKNPWTCWMKESLLFIDAPS